jgi:hypothetical protein
MKMSFAAAAGGGRPIPRGRGGRGSRSGDLRGWARVPMSAYCRTTEANSVNDTMFSGGNRGRRYLEILWLWDAAGLGDTGGVACWCCGVGLMGSCCMEAVSRGVGQERSVKVFIGRHLACNAVQQSAAWGDGVATKNNTVQQCGNSCATIGDYLLSGCVGWGAWASFVFLDFTPERWGRQVECLGILRFLGKGDWGGGRGRSQGASGEGLARSASEDKGCRSLRRSFLPLARRVGTVFLPEGLSGVKVSGR